VKWHDGEEEWWQLELGASVEDSGRRLGTEGKWCRGSRGWSSPFYRGRESIEKAVTVSNRWR
jgi:hypothetical protein